MRISDWSSDVCSSDLAEFLRQLAANAGDARHQRRTLAFVDEGDERIADLELARARVADVGPFDERGVGRGGGGFGQVGDRGFGAAQLPADREGERGGRREEHTSGLQSLMRISYAVLRLKNKKKKKTHQDRHK